MKIRLLAAFVAIFSLGLARAADNDDNPYKNAKVGDAATYKLTVKVAGATVQGTSSQTVTAKTDKDVTLKVSFNVGGMEVQSQTQTIDITKPYDPTKAGGLPPGAEATLKKLKEGEEQIKIAGKDYKSTWTTYELKAKAMGQEIKGEAKVWMSKEFPLGLVKMEMNAEVGTEKMAQKLEMSMEATDAGTQKK